MKRSYSRKILAIGLLFLFLGASAFTTASAQNNQTGISGTLSRGGSTVWSENFDSYVAGSLLGGQGGWFTWENGTTNNANVTNIQSRSPANSVEIKGVSDMVHEWTGIKYVNCTLRAWAYVPADFTGTNYLILLSQYSGSSSKYDLQIYFKGETMELCDEDSINTTPYAIGEWGEIRVEIDFVNDWQQVYYNDVLWLSKSWTKGVNNGILELDAVDLWNNDGTAIYWDDLSIWAADAPPNTPELQIGSIAGPIGVKTTIKNIGTGAATNVSWTIALDGGFILVGKNKTDTIASLAVSGTADIKIPFVLGFGKTVITVTATCDEGPTANKEQNATVLLFFVLIK
jgi:hypothetical protein